MHVFLKQLGIDGDLSAKLFFDLGDAGEYHRLAFFWIGNDKIFTHRRRVGGGVFHRHGVASHEAMTSGGGAALYAAE